MVIFAVTATMMIVEIYTGLVFGSMALLADGLHMGSHATALGISALAYVYSRYLATDRRFTFGTGKINSLAAFASAVLLGAFAAMMAIESVERLIHPIEISIDQALLVATIGLLVNGGSAWLLGSTSHHHADDGPQDHPEHDHDHHHDHNLRAAYLHVLADALTSLFAIVALVTAKYLGTVWLDPVMGIVGSILVGWWSIGLMKTSATVLLDMQASPEVIDQVRQAVQYDPHDRVSDLHVWRIGHRIYAAEIAIVSDTPNSPEVYKARLPDHLNIVHVTIEVAKCTAHHDDVETPCSQ